MADTLPNFIFPANKTNCYTFNYIDTVNVSWYWDESPDGSSIGLAVWSKGEKNNTFYQRSRLTSLAANSSSTNTTLNFTGVPYPTIGHYQLFAYYQNGTHVAGPSSCGFTVTKKDDVAPQCRNCTASISNVPSGSSPGATATVSATGSPQPSASNGLSGGAIAGIVIGVLAALTIGGLLSWFFCLRSIFGKRDSREPMPIEVSGHGGGETAASGHEGGHLTQISVQESSGRPRMAELGIGE